MAVNYADTGTRVVRFVAAADPGPGALPTESDATITALYTDAWPPGTETAAIWAAIEDTDDATLVLLDEAENTKITPYYEAADFTGAIEVRIEVRARSLTGPEPFEVEFTGDAAGAPLWVETVEDGAWQDFQFTPLDTDTGMSGVTVEEFLAGLSVADPNLRIQMQSGVGDHRMEIAQVRVVVTSGGGSEGGVLIPLADAITQHGSPIYSPSGAAVHDGNPATFVSVHQDSTTSAYDAIDVVIPAIDLTGVASVTLEVDAAADTDDDVTRRLTWNVQDSDDGEQGAGAYWVPDAGAGGTYSRVFDEAYFAPGGLGETDDYVWDYIGDGTLTYAEFLEMLGNGEARVRLNAQAFLETTAFEISEVRLIVPGAVEIPEDPSLAILGPEDGTHRGVFAIPPNRQVSVQGKMGAEGEEFWVWPKAHFLVWDSEEETFEETTVEALDQPRLVGPDPIWVPYAVKAPAIDGATHWSLRLHLYANDPRTDPTPAWGATLYADSHFVPDNGLDVSEEPYLDGDQDNARWEGEPHHSTSVYEGPDPLAHLVIPTENFILPIPPPA